MTNFHGHCTYIKPVVKRSYAIKHSINL